MRGGAAVGKMMDTGVDKKFVQDVSNSLQPGSSGLFVTATGGDPAAVVSALKQFKGTVYHTNLSSEAEQSLRSARGNGAPFCLLIQVGGALKP